MRFANVPAMRFRRRLQQPGSLLVKRGRVVLTHVSNRGRFPTGAHAAAPGEPNLETDSENAFPRQGNRLAVPPDLGWTDRDLGRRYFPWRRPFPSYSPANETGVRFGPGQHRP